MFLSVVQLCLEAEGRFIQYILVVYVILRYDSQFSTGDMWTNKQKNNKTNKTYIKIIKSRKQTKNLNKHVKPLWWNCRISDSIENVLGMMDAYL